MVSVIYNQMLCAVVAAYNYVYKKSECWCVRLEQVCRQQRRLFTSVYCRHRWARSPLCVSHTLQTVAG